MSLNRRSAGSVTEASFDARHRMVTRWLWGALPVLVVVGLLGPMPRWESVVIPGAIAVLAVAGGRPGPRARRGDLTSLGVISAAFAGIELSGGQVHAHLFVLSAVALVSVYQRWGPLLFTVGAVLVHHVVLGVLAPERAFSMSAGMGETMAGAMAGEAYPVPAVLLMVLAHTTAVALEVAALLMFWRFSAETSAELHQTVVELEAREAELHHQATHDPLTGLSNRSRFASEVMSQITEGGQFAVLMLDLDDFKLVNDTHGHAAGDQLLQAVAERMHRCVRAGDVAARLGGDEFAILVRHVVDAGHLEQVADEVLEQMSEPFELDDIHATVRVSIGIVHTDGGTSMADLMRLADSAMYRAKRQGKGQWVLHGSEEAAVEPVVEPVVGPVVEPVA